MRACLASLAPSANYEPTTVPTTWHATISISCIMHTPAGRLPSPSLQRRWRDIRILAKSVSREHCAIEQDGDDLVLRDLGSTGGTFLDGSRVEKVRLQDGMEINVGPAVLKFYESGI